jgi:hypothetical protein
MEKLKIIAIVTTIVCVLSLLTLYYFSKKIPENVRNVTAEISKELCNIFAGEEKNLCLEFQEICKDQPEPDKIQCIASYLVWNVSKESAWKMCQLKEEKNLQLYCMANVLVPINLNEALAECDKMDGSIKYFCRADQKKKVMGIEAGLPECENLKENFPIDYHVCRALTYSGVNKELAKKECELIEVEERRTSCLAALT